MIFYTYLYIDPKINAEIYVGKGKGWRCYSHFKCNNGRLGRTLRKRLSQGYLIEPIIEYHKNEQTAFAMEIFWIAVYGREDLGKGTLFNRTEGGSGGSVMLGRKHSAETILKMSESAKKALAKRYLLNPTVSKETKLKMSISMRGIKHGPQTEEHKLKTSIFHKNRTHSEEEKKNRAIGVQKWWDKRRGVSLC